VLLVLGTVLVIGGCAIKRQLDKLPPRNLPDDVPPDPPQPPTETNEPPVLPPYIFLPPIPALRVAVDDANRGMVRWDLARSSYVSNHVAAFTDPNTGQRYTDLIVLSVQARPALDVANWITTGSRMTWLSASASAGSAVTCYYDATGAPVWTNYCRAGGAGWQGMAENPNDTPSSIALLPWEAGTNRFFRLAASTNRIAILTAP
jgi:hypothetical protein